MMITSKSDLEAHAKLCADQNAVVRQEDIAPALIEMLEDTLVGAAHPIEGYYARDVLKALYMSGES